MPADRVLLLDGHSLAYRAFYALPVENFSTTTGQPTNAVYGFASMLINVLRDEQPTHVVVAFDVSRQTFRSQAYPEYKATRQATPGEFTGQVPLIKELLGALGIPAVESDGFEADDIIATLADQAIAHGADVLIVTGDRDAFQLVTEKVTVLYPRKGVSDLARMTPEAVEEKYGLTPGQYPDYAALRGDPSDNLPGIPGVGEKTATKWIAQYGSLAALVDHVDEVTGKAGDALRTALPQVLVNRQLTALRSDVPVSVDVLDCPRLPWDVPAVDRLFDTLQFRALRERLLAVDVGGGDSLVLVQPAVDARLLTAQEVPGWLASLQAPVAVAFQGAWGRGTGELEAIAVCDSRGACGICDLRDAGIRSTVLPWLADPAVRIEIHDAKGPLLALKQLGSDLGGLVMDTALAAYLAGPGQRSFALEDVTERLLGRPLDAAKDAGQLAFEGDDHAGLAARAVAVRDLADVLGRTLLAEGTMGVLADIELPLVDVLAGMERVGIALDVPGLHALSGEFGADMQAAEQRAHQIVGRQFNLGSPKQLQEILFTERRLPKTKKIKTGYTTDAEALQGLFERTQDPLLEQLLAWRDRSRLRQTVDGLIPLADARHRVHTTFNQTVAATGRLSSTDPNLQNIPIRTDAGRRIRACFVVGEGFESLMTADYSQIEMRIMAHVSADAGLIEAFRSGEDLHTTVASQVFGVPAGEVDAEMRRRIKAMSYGLAYGLSAFGLAQQLGIGNDEARALMDEYFTRFGGVRDYLAEVVDQARVQGYTQTLLGRRRYLPDLTSDNRQRREMAERMALNAPIQGTAADIVKIAMLRVNERIAAEGLRSRMLLQVHDELVLEVAPGERETLEGIVRAGMGAAADLRVPLDVSVGFGPNWEAAAH
ncbi:MAG: DNA polymerase I [Actinomycetales bacterium]|nr:DNA polymerase I [Actinomycetales bacterium]